VRPPRGTGRKDENLVGGGVGVGFCCFWGVLVCVCVVGGFWGGFCVGLFVGGGGGGARRAGGFVTKSSRKREGKKLGNLSECPKGR